MLHAVVFDIGGVLELTPPTGYRERWEKSLGLGPGDLDQRMYEVWRGGTLGTVTVEQVHESFVLSSSFVGAREKERERYGFEEMTDVIVYSHESGTAKADPAIYRLVCERLDVEPQNAVFVDDHERAVDGARAIGMNAVLSWDNAPVISELESLLAHPDCTDTRSIRADRLP
jgi:putative hydrolase of the HAD superfamily